MLTVVLAIAVLTGVLVLLSALLVVAEKYLASYGECTITVNGGEVAFSAPGGGTLLKTLLERRIFLPSACGGKGSCGYCKVTLPSGGGPILPTEVPFMSRAELRSGVRLACQVKVKTDLDVHFSSVYLSVREFRGRVGQVRALTHDIKEITIEILDGARISFRPGQYVQIRAPGPEGPVYRAYSVSSPAYEGEHIQLVVRLVPGGIASTYIHGLEVEDEVVFTGPYGEFRLSDDATLPVVCVGGGAGMAPIASILATVTSSTPSRPCYLFFGCRTTKDVFYLDRFNELAREHPGLQVCYALSDPLEPQESWTGDTGFIHLSVDKRLPAGSRCQAFLCGPPPMIEAVTEVLASKGLRPEDIFYDKF
jgi:Na+-transporting NADH:ubiquinone oxidoreductase subunit F